MLSGRMDLILSALQAGTGAEIHADISQGGLRKGIRLWFADLGEKNGPVAEIKPFGLGGYRVELKFGNFSGNAIRQIRSASLEDVQLARALVESIRTDAEIQICGQSISECHSEWLIQDGSFIMTVTLRGSSQLHSEELLTDVCSDVLVPMMAAMAELIGYDTIEDCLEDVTPAQEGAISQGKVLRRERNPRNRLLCIRIHGEICNVCGIEPRRQYGAAGSIIEVHHLEPLALANVPRQYDPRTDLVPLCPSCHRAVHTRRPVPFAPEELKKIMEDVGV